MAACYWQLWDHSPLSGSGAIVGIVDADNCSVQMLITKASPKVLLSFCAQEVVDQTDLHIGRQHLMP